MDDTNKNPNEDNKTEDVNPGENLVAEERSDEATNQMENANEPSNLSTSEPDSSNPFAALKEPDPEVEEAVEATDSNKEAAGEEKAEVKESENIQAFAEAEEKRDAEAEAAEEPETAAEKAEEEPKEDAEPAKPEPPVNPNARWYVVHTFAGHENKVATALRQRIEAERLENLIYDILVPTQDKIEIRGGKKETVKEKIFPGYILIKMELSDLSWLAVRTTQGVTSFIGAGNKPTPISEAEVATIVKFTSQGAQPTFKDVFMVDDTVKIVDGPFAEFIGKVDSVDKEKGRVRVLVSIFGRETPVELDFLQVQKL